MVQSMPPAVFSSRSVLSGSKSNNRAPRDASRPWVCCKPSFRASRDAVALLGLALNFRASRDAVALLGFALILKTVAAITTRTVSPKSDAHALSPRLFGVGRGDGT